MWFYQNFQFFPIQGGNLLKQISNWWQFLTFLISHTISYCFSTRCTYLTPVLVSDQLIALLWYLPLRGKNVVKGKWRDYLQVQNWVIRSFSYTVVKLIIVFDIRVTAVRNLQLTNCSLTVVMQSPPPPEAKLWNPEMSVSLNSCAKYRFATSYNSQTVWLENVIQEMRLS